MNLFLKQRKHVPHVLFEVGDDSGIRKVYRLIHECACDVIAPGVCNSVRDSTRSVAKSLIDTSKELNVNLTGELQARRII